MFTGFFKTKVIDVLLSLHSKEIYRNQGKYYVAQGQSKFSAHYKSKIANITGTIKRLFSVCQFSCSNFRSKLFICSLLSETLYFKKELLTK